jgi:hypothetical protein
MRPVSGFGPIIFFVSDQEDLSGWDQRVKLYAATGPPISLRFAEFPSRIAGRAPVVGKPIEKRITFSVVRPNADIAVADERPHVVFLEGLQA